MRRFPFGPVRSWGRRVSSLPNSGAVGDPPETPVIQKLPLPRRPQDDALPTAEILRQRSGVEIVLGGRSDVRNAPLRQFSSLHGRDDISIEEEVEKKAGWVLKFIFIGTAGLVGYQFFPYMGDNLLQQSISLLHVKDPLFKRMGASRLARFAVDDERRMKVVDLGGAQELLTMLEGAKDDKTRKEALKALVALSYSDGAAEFLDQAGAVAIVDSILNSSEYPEIGAYKTSLLNKFQELKNDAVQLEGEMN
ncbi:uncharacterized protein [Typha latifolia]|uniref:uncharacterized protein n=1 Tax=Typha latifolia TaxID=4733 RepID=UPI003C303749